MSEIGRPVRINKEICKISNLKNTACWVVIIGEEFNARSLLMIYIPFCALDLLGGSWTVRSCWTKNFSTTSYTGPYIRSTATVICLTRRQLIFISVVIVLPNISQSKNNRSKVWHKKWTYGSHMPVALLSCECGQYEPKGQASIREQERDMS